MIRKTIEALEHVSYEDTFKESWVISIIMVAEVLGKVNLNIQVQKSIFRIHVLSGCYRRIRIINNSNYSQIYV